MRALIVAACLAAFFTFSGSANAAEANCDALSNSPQVCVINNSHSQITGIKCGSAGGVDVNVPGGSIPVNGLTVVQFDTPGRCKTHMQVITRDKTYTYDGFDTAKNTKLSVSD